MQPEKRILAMAVLTALALQCCSQSVNPAVPRLCYSCEGIECLRSTSSNRTVQCSDKLDVCATIFEGFAVSERGCYLQLSQAAHAKCGAAAGEQLECQKCMGELCNGKGRADFKCLQCSGSETAKCQAAQCAAPTSLNSYCYVRLDEQQNLQRGCALTVAEQDKCLRSSRCSLCSPADYLGHAACNNYALKGSTKSSAYRHQLPSVLPLLLLLLLLPLAHKLFN